MRLNWRTTQPPYRSALSIKSSSSTSIQAIVGKFEVSTLLPSATEHSTCLFLLTTLQGVFKNIINHDPNSKVCSPLLSHISVVVDYKGPKGKYFCNGDVMAV